MRAKKRLGQHFLHDPGVIRRLVDTIRPQPSDTMVEIGGGPGALTIPLSDKLERLHVVEVDGELAAALPSRVAHPERLVVHEADALEFDFGALATGPHSLRVVGNLPYNISTPLLFHLAGHAAAILDMHVMLQREVVERMVATPSTSQYGRLSVMLQYRFEMEQVLAVPATAFDPAPKVESAVVRLAPFPRLPHPARDEAQLGMVVTAAFSQRRKTLRNALKGYFRAADFERLGLDGGLRAQDLSVADFVRLADTAAGAAS